MFEQSLPMTQPCPIKGLPLLGGQRWVLGIGGGIAAYKAADLIRTLQKQGVAQVTPILSENAHHFITPLTLAALAQTPALQDNLEVDPHGVPWHITLAQHNDGLVIAPATANTLATLAAGLATDLLSTTALTFTHKPIVLVPTMNPRMWQNPVVQHNIAHLKALLPNLTVVPPASGLLACGEVGEGHWPPTEAIVLALYKATHPHQSALAGQHVLVSGGGTREPLDPVRYLTNHSSGLMGVALADEAYALGATVTLVSAQPVLPHRPYNVMSAPTVQAMLNVMLAEQSHQHAILMAAAVSDFMADEVATTKLKKPRQANERFNLCLKKAPDILATLSHHKPPGQVLLGFAAETLTPDAQHEGIAHAQGKLTRKGLDWIALNDVSRDDIGFATMDNEMLLLGAEGQQVALPKAPKPVIAQQLLAAMFNLA
jgi:phosphopantothenoylcysteine decarboxylase/phosphopantothenate--cysteine ligase